MEALSQNGQLPLLSPGEEFLGYEVVETVQGRLSILIQEDYTSEGRGAPTVLKIENNYDVRKIGEDERRYKRWLSAMAHTINLGDYRVYGIWDGFLVNKEKQERRDIMGTKHSSWPQRQFVLA